MVPLFLLVFMVVCGIAAFTGHVVDTRDPEYSLGRLLADRAAPGEENR